MFVQLFCFLGISQPGLPMPISEILSKPLIEEFFSSITRIDFTLIDCGWSLMRRECSRLLEPDVNQLAGWDTGWIWICNWFIRIDLRSHLVFVLLCSYFVNTRLSEITRHNPPDCSLYSCSARLPFSSLVCSRQYQSNFTSPVHQSWST